MLQNEKVLRTGHASTPDDAALLIDQACTEIGGEAIILASEDTLKGFVMRYDGLLNPLGTFERMKLEKKFFGRLIQIEPKAVGSIFIITDTHNCIVVRYDPA